MHVFLEDTISRRSDSTVHSLSWMNENISDEHSVGCQGWLASGNTRSVVGVTYTDSGTREAQQPARMNFNLRGHRDAVIMVRWNEAYQKLATCDVNGVIFVWIKHNDKWSIELINDRNIQVTDFCWSHDGRMALICYRDGFVLVGSVAGRRLWSSSLRVDSAIVTCASWTPAGQKVMFGTSVGRIIVLNWQGEVLFHLTLQPAKSISQLLWSHFTTTHDWESADSAAATPTASPQSTDDCVSTLAICFKDDVFHLLRSYDDLSPRTVSTGLTGIKMEWSRSGELLAVGGFVRLPNLECSNEVRFYKKSGELVYRLPLKHQNTVRLTGLTWGHRDRRLFIAIGCHVYTACVSQDVPTIEFLSRQCIKKWLHNKHKLHELPLPAKLRTDVAAVFLSTIKGYVPDCSGLRQFVCVAPSVEKRLYCSMVRHRDDQYGSHYTLYLEYLGGLLPLLKARRTSKIRPEFVIFDPTPKVGRQEGCGDAAEKCDDGGGDGSSDSDRGAFDGCSSPRLQRRKRPRKMTDTDSEANDVTTHDDTPRYNDDLPESRCLVEVTSNFWGTKFTMRGVGRLLPTDLGAVVYKTSLLHLQPRQMCLRILHLRASGDVEASYGRSAGCSDGRSAGCSDGQSAGCSNGQAAGCSGGHSAGCSNGQSAGCSDGQAAGCSDRLSERGRQQAALDGSTANAVNYDSLARVANSKECSDDDDDMNVHDQADGRPKDIGGSLSERDRGRAAVVSPRGECAPLLLCGALPAHLPGTSTAAVPSDVTSSNWAVKAHDDVALVDHNTDDWPDTPPLPRRPVATPPRPASPAPPCPAAVQPVVAAFTPLHTSSLLASAASLPDLVADDMLPDSAASQSLPSSPLHVRHVGKKHRLRLWRKKDGLVANGGNYGGLEAFQKAQLSKKLRRGKACSESEHGGQSTAVNGYVLMRNKTPQWNDISQVYQLDFGGRVTQESAKNFQVEFDGKQVLQFGRIESNAYTLDFEQPFSAIQAFAVALANVTQRLK